MPLFLRIPTVNLALETLLQERKHAAYYLGTEREQQAGQLGRHWRTSLAHDIISASLLA